MKKILIALSLISSLSVGTSFADNGPYVGIGLGASDSSWGSSDFGVGTGNVDNTDLTYRLIAGYNFHPNFGVEFSYEDLGNTDDSNDFAELDLHAVSIAGIGRLPLNKEFDVYGKLGIAQVVGDFSINNNSNKTYNDSLLIGAGSAYHFNDTYDVKIEWNRYINALDTNNDIDSVSLGVYYNF